MEEIEYKLKKSGNPVLIAHTITKLVDTIKTKYIEQQNLSLERGKEIPELKLLREKCSDESNLVSLTACQGMVHLVETQFIQVAPTLTDFIAALSSASNCTGITQGIGNLLIYDMNVQLKSTKSYKCLFTLTSPQHPIITVLRQNENIWINVLNQMQSLLLHHDQRIANESFQLFRPVIVYILCNPTKSVSEKCRCDVWSLLMHCGLTSKYNVEEFILGILPWIQSPNGPLLLSKFMIELIETSLVKNKPQIYIGLLPFLGSIAAQLISNGDDPRACFKEIDKIITSSKILQPEAYNHLMIILGETINKCPSVYLEDLIRICSKIIKTGCITKIISHMIIAPVLIWMTYPSTILNKALDIADEIIQTIQKTKEIKFEKEEGTITLHSNKWFQSTLKMDIQLHRTSLLTKLSSKNFKSWLQHTESPSYFLEINFWYYTSIFISETDPEITEFVLTLLLKIVKHNKELSGNVLTLILFKLTKERFPKIQLLLLKSIPEMGVLKENVPLIVNTLESFENGPEGLQGISVDLFCRLWRVESRCYPYLERVLIKNAKDVTNTSELDVVKAMTLKKICLLTPEKHGTQVVPLLSNILNRCGDVNGAFASSLALQGITSLCKAGIVDIISTWKLLSPKLCKGNRPLITKCLCEFLSIVPNLKPATSPTNPELITYDEFITETIAKLWNYVTSNDLMIGEALKALSCFNVEEMTLKDIPENYRQNLKLPSQYVKTPLDANKKPEDVLPYIPGECWVQFLENIHETGLEAATNLLIAWTRKEISGYVRSVYTVKSGQGEPLSYSSNLLHKSILRALTVYLQQQASGANFDNRRDITVPCLRVLNQDYEKALPPLNWSFLHEIFHRGSAEKQECLLLMTKQSVTSGSAQRFMENYVTSAEKEEDILNVLKLLKKLCNSVQPLSLGPFLEKALKLGYEVYKNGDSKLLRTTFGFIKETLAQKNIHDANRCVISQLLETMFEKFTFEENIFSDYTDCCEELQTDFIERLTSPTVWWEVNDEKLKKALIIRKKLADRKDLTSRPLVWFNDSIDFVMGYRSCHIFLLRLIYSSVSNYRNDASTGPWLSELMGRIQAVMVETDIESEKIEYFCDVFSIVVITLANNDLMLHNKDSVIISREVRISLLPHSMARLVSENIWNFLAAEAIDFFLHMMKSTILSQIYKDMFKNALIALKNNSQFQKPSIWMNCVSE